MLTDVGLKQLESVTSIVERMHTLDGLIHKAPNQPRLHYQRALELWRQGAIPAALRDLEVVARIDPTRPGLRFLLQLGYLVDGRPWQTEGLTPVETNTLLLPVSYTHLTLPTSDLV